MWLVTPIGFFSIAQKSGDEFSGTLTVRARVHNDLIALRQHYLPSLGEIQESHNTDYRFHATASRTDISSAFSRILDTLNYDNFKNEVDKKQGHKRSTLYHEVSDILYKLQADPAFADYEHRPADGGESE